MIFCDDCAKARNWPQSTFRSLGRCECCGAHRGCSDIPSRDLPDTKIPESAKTVCTECGGSGEVVNTVLDMIVVVVCSGVPAGTKPIMMPCPSCRPAESKRSMEMDRDQTDDCGGVDGLRRRLLEDIVIEVEGLRKRGFLTELVYEDLLGKTAKAGAMISELADEKCGWKP